MDKRRSARAEVFEVDQGHTQGFGIMWLGRAGNVQSTMCYLDKAYTLELARRCGARSVTDTGKLHTTATDS
jgi:hypothetical protein